MRNGELMIFDTPPSLFEVWGCYPHSRVMTPIGPATVIGIANCECKGGKSDLGMCSNPRELQLWFHADSDKGATHWVS